MSPEASRRMRWLTLILSTCALFLGQPAAGISEARTDSAEAKAVANSFPDASSSRNLLADIEALQDGKLVPGFRRVAVTIEGEFIVHHYDYADEPGIKFRHTWSLLRILETAEPAVIDKRVLFPAIFSSPSDRGWVRPRRLEITFDSDGDLVEFRIILPDSNQVLAVSRNFSQRKVTKEPEGHDPESRNLAASAPAAVPALDASPAEGAATADCSHIDSVAACVSNTNNKAAAAPPSVRLTVEATALQSLIKGESVLVPISIKASPELAAPLLLRLTGVWGRTGRIREEALLELPIRSRHVFEIKPPKELDDGPVNLSISVQIVDEMGQELAGAAGSLSVNFLERVQEDKKAAAINVKRDRAASESDLVRRAAAQCVKSSSFKEYDALFGKDQQALHRTRIARLGAAIDSFLAIRRKAEKNRDTYLEYRDYASKYSDSPCAATAKDAMTVAYWLTRNLSDESVVMQLDLAIRFSGNARLVEEAEKRLATQAAQGNPVALLRQAKIDYNARKIPEASKALAQLEHTHPSRDVFLYLGHIHSRDCARAVDYLSKAIRLDAECFECFFHRAECLDTLGQTSRAQDDFRNVIALTAHREGEKSSYYNKRGGQRYKPPASSPRP